MFVLLIKGQIKIDSTIAFKTLSRPCFNEYYDLFYKDKRKIVPKTIQSWWSPRSLAYWIMDEGGLISYKQTMLCTHFFSISEIELIQEALSKRFHLRRRVSQIINEQWWYRSNKKKSGFIYHSFSFPLHLKKGLPPLYIYPINHCRLLLRLLFSQLYSILSYTFPTFLFL